MADVVLIYPKTGFDIGAGVCPPFSVLTVAAEIYDKYEVKIIDQRVDPDWEDALKNELKKQPHCVGISSMTGYQIIFALKSARIVKENSDTAVVWGGIHSTLTVEQTISDPYVDMVVRGEGEKTFAELVGALKEKRSDFKDIKGLTYKKDGVIIHTENRPFMDMNDLKETPWGLVNVNNYMHSGIVIKNCKRELDIGETSRGCPHGCGFCYNSVFNKRRWRGMSAEKVLEKIIDHVGKFNLDGIWLRDDEFFVDLERAEKVARTMIEKKLNLRWYTSGIRLDMVRQMSDDLIELFRKSGCEGFRFGVESGNKRILDLINKRITIEDILEVNRRMKKHGIEPHYSFMVGFPTETIDEALQTVSLMKELRRENPFAHLHGVNMYTPYPGTELFKRATECGLKMPESLKEWSEFHHLNNYAVHLSDKEREMMTNISDISYLISDSMLNAIPRYLKYLMLPVTLWLNFRWRHNLFKSALELKALRYARHKIMMKK